MEVITSHINADFDAFASAMAAKKLYPQSIIVFPGSLEKKVRDFIDAYRPIEITKIKNVSFEKINRLVIVDTKNPERIGPFREILSKPGIKIHIYDHHPITKDDIRGELEVIENVGAVSTIFTELIQKKKITISPLEATILCLGIYEETGSLLYTSTTPRDLMAVSFLLTKGANLNLVSSFLKTELSREEFTLLNELIQSLKEVVINGIRIKIGKGTMEDFGDVAHLAQKIMDMEDIEAVILIINMSDKILIIGRSRASELDISQVLSEFGGGGHATAAAATIKEASLEIIEERLIESLNRHIKPLKSAKDVMTAPVIVIQHKNTVKEAEDMMTRYGVNVLPVVKKNRYLGILTREVVEKAIFHGFGKSKCIDFASTDAITVTKDVPVADVERLMIEQNQRFVPVLEGGILIGAITRTDILRALYEEFLKKSRISSKESAPEAFLGFGRNISKMLKEKLPEHLYEFLIISGEVADELHFGAYLVGGCVRDILRSEENLDIDLVIEGDGVSFAKKLASRIGGKVTVHERFGTAIITKNDFKLDIATARTEYYESPAALPKVEMSSIKKDLYRRDFTINTLAVKLNKKDFGLLLDFFGGQRDLKDKIIRVLHNLSFVEDPTRAFRAVRFAERFGFRITKHTENLIKVAIRMNIFDKLSGSRIYDELYLIFNETNPIKTIKRLSDYGLLKVIHPKLIFSNILESLMQSVHDSISWYDLLFLKDKYDKAQLYMMAFLCNIKDEDRKSALNRLNVPLNLREKIIKGLHDSQELLKNIKPDDPVKIYHLLKNYNIETILFSMALTDDNEKKKSISKYLLELKNIRPILKGEDLKALGIEPGPLYSEIFNKILNEKLMKRLQTKEEEIEFVQNLLI